VQEQTAVLIRVPQVAGQIWMDFVFAIVPQTEIPINTKLNIYDNKDGTLTVVINGKDKLVDGVFYRLGPAGISVKQGWHWQHSLPILAKILEEK